MLRGSLFTRDFLIEGICETDAWKALDDLQAAAVKERLNQLLAAFGKLKKPNEAETEKDLIWPLLEALGWADMSVQQNLSVKARDDVPDALLYASDEAKAKAAPLPPWQRFQHGSCIVEAKRWNRILDREDAHNGEDKGVPSTQMLRYLRRVDDVTNGGLRWGILTNGRHWRLYFRGALSVAEDFFEIDLGKICGLPGCELDLLDERPDLFGDDTVWRAHAFKLFVLIFGRLAFVPDHLGENFLHLALREGKQWEARVARDLSNTVFDRVFPMLCAALGTADGRALAEPNNAALEDIREGALILLYRLLFVLYAEDRKLLPDESGPYADYSLTRMRLEIADRKMRGASFSEHMKAYWSRLDGIFQAIGRGDDGLGIPPYNGGLFDGAIAPILGRIGLPDTVVAEVVWRLSHVDLGDGRPPKYINYRDLSVQQLGSVYERILEHGLKLESGSIVVAENPEARKVSGSYYTPEELVTLIIDRAVGPLVADRVQVFVEAAKALATSKRSKEARLSELLPLDPASRLLDVKVCDPAMGSGHFLVSLVDWLADRVLDAMAEAAAAASFVSYVSPLAARLASIRSRILAEAKRHKWPIAESQLDDRHIVRRMVLKRVVFGVDKNPMAVELAKVSLWLHSFTVGAPLSFLDHHLRCGDSVLGVWTRPTVDWLKERGALFNIAAITSVEHVARVMDEIEEKTDSDISEVKASKAAFSVVEEATKPVADFFSLLIAERMMGLLESAPKKAPPALEKMTGKSEKLLSAWREKTRAFEAASAVQLVLEGVFGEPIKIASGETQIGPPELVKQFSLIPTDEVDLQSSLFPKISVDDRRRVLANHLVLEARLRSAENRFFHWEIGFPNVWSQLLAGERKGGFDAVIGNPPYVRQALLGDEIKRALKANYAIFDGMADLYVYFFEQGLRLLRPGGRMSYVVTNKWLKAGYAERLRDLFATGGKIEFVADFGHAKHFFPDADVFPSVLVLRKAGVDFPAPAEVQVCVMPRDAVPEHGLRAAVAASTYPLPRAHFTKESWTLEPPDVVTLLDKIVKKGIPLTNYTSIRSFRGVTTGFNDAFFIDNSMRDRLVSEDPKCAEIIKPYLRGQDVERWYSPWTGLWMIFARRGIDIDQYPSIKRHLEKFRIELTPKPEGWKPETHDEKWPGRKEGSYAWYEIQDSVEYWREFAKPKIIYQAIQFYAAYAYDPSGLLLSNKAFFLTSDNLSLLALLNSPLGWWLSWRHFLHMKDEALSNDGVKIANFPISAGLSVHQEELAEAVSKNISLVQNVQTRVDAIRDWLHHEFDIRARLISIDVRHLEADGFITAVRSALPKGRKLSAAEIARLRQEYTNTLAPANAARSEIVSVERQISDIVNAAYELTPKEVALMWRTAPPRMPLDPADELRRLGIAS